MTEYGNTERQPIVSLIYLLLFILAGSCVFTIIGFILGIGLYGEGDIRNLPDMMSNINTNPRFLKLLQIISSVGTFVIPAVLFARVESKSIPAYLHLDKKVPLILLILAAAIMFSISPVFEWTIEVNRQMKLPEFLKGVEEWMRDKEDQLEELTKQLLLMKTFKSFLINMLMIAIIPAIGEEFIFRGCLQNIFTRWTKSVHGGIWISAIIFSAIHLQFYGFVPRMLLGALFGYLLVWGRSMWLPILAHFINNGAAVISSYIYQAKGGSVDDAESQTPQTWYIYLISFLVSIYLLWMFKTRAERLQSDYTYKD